MQRLLDRKEERQKMLLVKLRYLSNTPLLLSRAHLRSFPFLIQAKREAKRAALREAELATSSPVDSPSASRGRKASRSSKPPPHGSAQDQELDRDQASSGSESVSGGDEEMEVVVDEKLVSAVALAQQLAAQETAGATSAAPQGDVLSPHSPAPTQSRLKQGTTAAPAITKPPERKPAAVAGTERERVRRTRSTEKDTVPTTTATSKTTHNSASQDKPTPKGSNTAKRKSAFRTEIAAKAEEEDPQVQKIVISRSASRSQDAALQPSESSATIDTVNSADESENEERERAAEAVEAESTGREREGPRGDEVAQRREVTGEDLVADFESKNFAALQSLRSMKLKKVRHCAVWFCINCAWRASACFCSNFSQLKVLLHYLHLCRSSRGCLQSMPQTQNLHLRRVLCRCFKHLHIWNRWTTMKATTWRTP